MFILAALARADGPVFHIIDGRCTVFDAAGWLWVVEGLHVTSDTDPDGNTHLHCNATLPEGAVLPTGKPVVWDSSSCASLPVGTPPPGAYSATCDPDDGLIYCTIAGAGETSDWHDVINKSGRSNAACSFHPK